MYSYTGLRTIYGNFTNNTTSANLTNGDLYINTALRQIYASAPWDFLEKTITASTVASQQAYNLPYDYDKLIAMTVTIGTTQYIAREVADKITWDYLNQNTAVTSNIANYFFILNGQMLLWPMPSSSSNTITYTYRRRVRDLSIADYTTGTIANITNGTFAMAGNAPSWTTQMEGRYIRITRGNAVTTGDGEWYPIATVNGATTLTLGRAYAGTTLSAAAAPYVIGEMPALPEPYQQMPAYQAAAWYWIANENPAKAKMFQDLYDTQHEQLRADHLSKTTDDTINDIDSGLMRNPNLYILS